jgi:predicted dehydrogenase
VIRLEGGITFFMEEAWAIHADQPDGIHVYGDKGGVRLDPFTYFTTLGDLEMDGTFDLKQGDWRWHQCDPNTAMLDNSQAHWVAAQLGRIPLLDTAGIALNTAFITEGVYISGAWGREVTAAEIEQAEPGIGRV